MTLSVVRVRGVDKVFGAGADKTPALQKIDLEIPKGAFVSLIGPSGCGKSTLLRLIGDLTQPTAGMIEVNGKTVNVPSFQLKPGDMLKVKPANGVVDVALEASKLRPVPGWLAFNVEEKSGKILARPERHEMESGVEEQLIVEFYSR